MPKTHCQSAGKRHFHRQNGKNTAAGWQGEHGIMPQTTPKIGKYEAQIGYKTSVLNGSNVWQNTKNTTNTLFGQHYKTWQKGRGEARGSTGRKVKNQYSIRFHRQRHIVAEPGGNHTQHQDLTRIRIRRHKVLVTHQLTQRPQVSTFLNFQNPRLIRALCHHINALLS